MRERWVDASGRGARTLFPRLLDKKKSGVLSAALGIPAQLGWSVRLALAASSPSLPFAPPSDLVVGAGGTEPAGVALAGGSILPPSETVKRAWS